MAERKRDLLMPYINCWNKIYFDVAEKLPKAFLLLNSGLAYFVFGALCSLFSLIVDYFVVTTKRKIGISKHPTTKVSPSHSIPCSVLHLKHG